MNSPDLPIFGMTPATIGSRVQQQPMQSHQTANPQQHAAAGTQATPVAAAGKGGIGSEEDSTGELYSSLIHSNLTGVARASKEDSMQRDREPGTCMNQCLQQRAVGCLRTALHAALHQLC